MWRRWVTSWWTCLPKLTHRLGSNVEEEDVYRARLKKEKEKRTARIATREIVCIRHTACHAAEDKMKK